MSAISVMTTLPIATQKPLHEFVGQFGCQLYWGVNMAYQWVMVTSGAGMATYRLICFHYLFKKELNTKKISKYILLAELAIWVVIISLGVLTYSFFGWEKALFYQFCMNLGTPKINVIHEYTRQNDQLDLSHLKGLRFVFSLIGQVLFIAELFIYAWILYNLWKHDKKNHSEGIITEPMKKERNQKNVITLQGQVSSFLVETAFNIYVLVHISNLNMVEASFMPISLIVVSTIISAIQVATSHEMHRFLKNQFNLY